MKKTKTKNTVSLILNIAMAILVTVAIYGFFTDEGITSGVGNMDAGGVGCLRFFTNLSNIFASLCGLVITPFNIIAIKSGENKIPRWAILLKFVGTTAVTVTMTVVILFLGPIMGYVMMFEGNCFFLHLICPLISVISFCFLEGSVRISKKEALLGVIPVLIYATVYLVNVIFTEVWSDFYHFNIGGMWYISYIVMTAVTYVLALVIRTLHNKYTVRLRTMQ